MYKIFISHSSKDNDFAIKLAERLRKDNLSVWIDDWEIKVGDSIIEKINKGIDESGFFIIILSDDSIKSDWVNKELNIAIMRTFTQKKIKLLPILLDIDLDKVPPLLLDIKAAKFNRVYIDEKEYSKLIEPIISDKKAKELNEYQDNFFEDVEHIDIILNKTNPTKSEVNFVLNIIKEEKYANYFFRNAKSLIWFNILKKNNYFNPDKIPLPEPAEKDGYYKIPYWNVLDYLEKVSQQTNTPTNEIYAEELINIMKEVTEYFRNNQDKLDNYKVWWIFISILSNLPNHKITDEVLDLIPFWINSKFGNSWQISEIINKLLPKFVQSNDNKDIGKAEKIFKFLLEIKWEPVWIKYPDYKYLLDIPEKQRTEEQKNTIRLFNLDKQIPKLIFDHFLLLPEKESLIKEFGKKCGKDFIYWISDNIKNIFEKEKYKESYDLTMVWIDNIFHLDYGHGDASLFLITILIEMIVSRVNNSDTIEILNTFIKKYEYPIFKRIVLRIVGEDWSRYNKIFWQLVATDKEYKLFNWDRYSNDLYYVFNKSVGKFTVDDKEKIKNIVENHVPNKPHSEEQYKEYYAAYRKQKFYQALKNDESFKDLYNKCKEITKTDVETTSIKTYSGPGISPLSKDDVLNKTNQELIEFFLKFKSEDWIDKPSVYGLCHVLREVVSNYPEKFYNDLRPFVNSPYIYVYNILWGFSDALEQNKELDWEKILDFIEKYIKKEDFWKDAYTIEKDDSNHLWVIGNIGWLIRKGISEINKVPEKYYLKIFNILMFILEKMKIENEINKESDYFMLALNSSVGKVLEALILLVSNIHGNNNIKDSEKSQVIHEFIKKYEEILDKKNIESYVWFGTYLNVFDKLDNNWTKGYVNGLINSEVKLWEAFIVGCSYNRQFFSLYNLLKLHYDKFVSHYTSDFRQVSKRIIEHICVWYLNNIELMEDNNSLFNKLVNIWYKEQITDIISFFWMQRDEDKKHRIEEDENKNLKEKIIYFWEWIYKNKLKNKTNYSVEEKEILADLSKLAIFLDEIKENSFEWLKLSAKYVTLNFNYYFFIEYLDHLKDKGNSEKVKKYIGEIYLEILNNSEEYPQYPTENIESIIKFLYENNNKENADEICNKYAEKGLYFLRKIYDEFNSK